MFFHLNSYGEARRLPLHIQEMDMRRTMTPGFIFIPGAGNGAKTVTGIDWEDRSGGEVFGDINNNYGINKW